MLRHTFPAMGTTVEALLEYDVPDGPAALVAVESEFERLESVLSRFRPGSALSRLNREGRIDGEPDLARLVELALTAREETEGRFDPTIHDALVAAGYDRSFEDVAPSGPADFVAQIHLGAAGSVRVDGDSVELEPGVRLDLGGIGKGYAVDRAVATLAGLGPCLVNAGGDLAVAGLPRAREWAVSVETPAGHLTLGLTSGALATSGRDRRRWIRGGEERHHLIDPASGRPAESRWLRVTVAASTAVAAEVAAKDVFLGAEPAGRDALLVALDGTVTRTGALA
jgi:thiamine biosynthesis lipoprotein